MYRAYSALKINIRFPYYCVLFNKFGPLCVIFLVWFVSSLFCHLAFYLPFFLSLIFRYYNHPSIVQIEKGLLFLQSLQVNSGIQLLLSDIYLDLKLRIIHTFTDHILQSGGQIHGWHNSTELTGVELLY